MEAYFERASLNHAARADFTFPSGRHFSYFCCLEKGPVRMYHLSFASYFFVIVVNMETKSPVMSNERVFQYMHQLLLTCLLYVYVPQMIFTFLYQNFILAVKLSFEQNIIKSTQLITYSLPIANTEIENHDASSEMSIQHNVKYHTTQSVVINCSR